MTLATNNITNEAGTGGPDFSHMPSVGGDPVVESGSNSDGEWTRWADGTQISFSSVTLSYSSADVLSVDWTYPAPFISNPKISSELSLVNYAATPAGNQLGISATLNPAPLSITVRRYRIAGQTGFSSGDTVNTQVSAFGRWK